jgi:hypothetical protein
MLWLALGSMTLRVTRPMKLLTSWMKTCQPSDVVWGPRPREVTS